MKAVFAGVLITLAVGGAAAAQGQHQVSGYFRRDGTYVAPHYQTNPDQTRANNWSTVGNVNPYTGEPGTKPLYPEPSYSYTPPRTYTPPAPSYVTPAPRRPATSSYGF